MLATEKGLKYDIKRVNAKSNEIYVSNLKIEDVSDGSENIKVLLKRAQKNRAVAATNCNERSSRSHSVFVLKITGNGVRYLIVEVVSYKGVHVWCVVHKCDVICGAKEVSVVGADLDPIVQGLGVAELPTGCGDGVPSGYQVDVVCGVGELKLRLLDSSLLKTVRKNYHFI